MVSQLCYHGILRVTSEVWFTELAEEFRMQAGLNLTWLKIPDDTFSRDGGHMQCTTKQKQPTCLTIFFEMIRNEEEEEKKIKKKLCDDWSSTIHGRQAFDNPHTWHSSLKLVKFSSSVYFFSCTTTTGFKHCLFKTFQHRKTDQITKAWPSKNTIKTNIKHCIRVLLKLVTELISRVMTKPVTVNCRKLSFNYHQIPSFCFTGHVAELGVCGDQVVSKVGKIITRGPMVLYRSPEIQCHVMNQLTFI